jgi:hypothetical protein
MNHPLVTYFVLVDKRNRDAAARLNLVFVLAHTKYHAGVVRREFRTSVNLDAIISSQFLAVPWQTLMIAVHHHAATVEGHIVTLVPGVLVLCFSLLGEYETQYKDAENVKNFYKCHSIILK